MISTQTTCVIISISYGEYNFLGVSLVSCLVSWFVFFNILTEYMYFVRIFFTHYYTDTMSYPILPFSSEWEIPIKTKATTNSSQYGESAIRQRELTSINPLKRTRAISITLNTQSKVTLAENFLEANIGKPVRIPYSDIFGTSGDDGNLYLYKEIVQTFFSPSCSAFSIECEQIRRLKPA